MNSTVIEKLTASQGLARPRGISRPPPAPLALTRACRISRTPTAAPAGGDDIDLSAATEVLINRRLRLQPEFKRKGTERGVSSIVVLIDLSESTNDRAVDSLVSLLDIEKQAALRLAGATTAGGERFAVHGFFSNTCAEVYYTRLIEFGAMQTPALRAQDAVVQAPYSTHVGAACGTPRRSRSTGGRRSARSCWSPTACRRTSTCTTCTT